MTGSVTGRHRGDVRYGDLPDDLRLGDIWRYVGEDGSPLSARGHANGADPQAPVHGNLTDEMWGYVVPMTSPSGSPGIGTLVLHTVRTEDDGTVSIRPGDGSSNSVLHTSRWKGEERQWHGYVEHCVWTPC
jgi:hypothetical protein